MYYEEIARVVTGLGVTCVGTLAAQEGQFGDVIQPESGGLSPSDAGNHSLRAGGGARSHPSSGGGAGGGAFSFPPCVLFRPRGPAGAPQHGGGCLLSCIYSPVPTSPGNATPAASPEVASPLAGHAETLLNTAPRFTGRAAMVPTGRALALHLDCPPTCIRPSLIYRLNTVLLG